MRWARPRQPHGSEEGSARLRAGRGLLRDSLRRLEPEHLIATLDEGVVLEPQGERRTLRLQLSLAGARVTTQATAGPHLFGAERSRGRLDCGRAAPTFERCWSWRMPSPRTAERLAEAIWGYLSFARIARTSMRGGGVYSRSATGLALHAGTFLERALGAAQGVRRLCLSQPIRFGSGGAC